MYVSKDMKSLPLKIHQIKDAIDFNYSLDIDDIPFSKFGIEQTIPITNSEELFNRLRLQFNNLQQQQYLSDVTLTNVNIDPSDLSKVILTVKYNNQEVKIGVTL